MTKKFISIFLCFVLLTGCSAPNNSAPTLASEAPSATDVATPTPSEEPISGGEIKLAMHAPQTLNPLLNEDVTVDSILQLIFEPLADIDETGKAVPNLIDSYVNAADGKAVTITLRSGLTWSDGTSITTSDVTYSIDAIKKSADNTIYKDNVSNISYCDTVDDKTMTIYFNHSEYNPLYCLCFPIIPNSYYENSTSLQSDVNMNPVGDGMFVFESYNLAKDIKLSSNPNYFKQKPWVDSVDVLIIPDSSTFVYSFDEGVVNALATDVDTWSKYRGTKVANIASYTTNDYEFIGFNFDNPLLNDKSVRQAIAYSLDIDAIVSEVYLNYAVRTYTPICSDSWLYDSSTTNVYDFSNQKAMSVLDSAGYKDSDGDGVVEKDVDGAKVPLDFKILVNETNSQRVDIANTLQESLGRIGIKSEITSLPNDEYATALKSGDFDLFIGGVKMPEDMDLSFLFSTNAQISGLNYFNYSNPELDAVLSQAESSTTEDGYFSCLSEAQKIISNDLPCISLVYVQDILLTDNTISGNIKPTADNVYGNMNEWFINGKG